ncbi:SCP1.201-like deaminase [Amycolatopsis carbonis]|uniref:SCP1.201-like deaminase n=1 Tax=Amycolatopsis carbonis TaxID=715471 RepID=A0A9Y2MVL8_9PSEU|nr:DddA-like double-stranded DNA deaminase toxin [Amycolatopsis sp. 2-15]WIX78923.1 SCP1.201-like deaminase [Amycolatopsis sp. 2-15]
MSVEELVQSVAAVVGKIATARKHLLRARQSVEEAGQALTQARQGSHAREVGQALRVLSQSGQGIATADQLAGLASAKLEGYVARLAEAGVGASGGVADRSAGAPSPQPQPGGRGWREGLVEKLRQELPPPVVPRTGQKTVGRWFAPGKTGTALMSGHDDRAGRVNEILKDAGCPKRPLTAAADVELKLAAEMRDDGIMDATLVINNTPCTGKTSCDGLLGIVLPEGSTLTVYGTDGFMKVYEGGAKWQS